MRYFVIAPDGSKYGPADVMTLRSWVAEGRIAPNTMLEEETSRQRVEARLVAGLFGTETQMQAPYSRGGRPEHGQSKNDGSMDLVWSYLCSALSIICCGFFIIGGFVYANKAIAKGNRGGKAARIVAWFFLFLWIVTTIIEVIFIKDLMEFFQKSVAM